MDAEDEDYYDFYLLECSIQNCYCMVALLITSHMALLLYMYRNKCTLRTFVDAIGKLFINL